MIRDCCKGEEANAIFEPNTKELLEKVGYIPSATDAEPTIKKGDLQKVYDVARELDPNAMPGSLGYSVITKAYTRYATGEGIEKKEENFAAEVASMIK